MLPTATAGVSLHFHGYPAVSVEGRVLPIKLKRVYALLAYLCGHRTPIGRAIIAAILWPDSAPGVGRTRLRRLVHATNRAAGCEIVKADTDSLSLSEGCDCDLLNTSAAIDHVGRSEQPDMAVIDQLLRPDASQILMGFSIDADAFNDWLERWRQAHLQALLDAWSIAAAAAVSADRANTAEQLGLALLLHDPSSEQGHVARIESRALRGDLAGAESAYFECARIMRAEFGQRPSARVEAAYAKASGTLGSRELVIRYAPTKAGTVAYATWGQGEVPIVCFWGGANNLELALDERHTRQFLDRLATGQRVIMFDRRGTGVAERVGVVPDANSAVEDISAVLDHVGARRAWLFGARIGGVFAIDFALRYPQRTAGIILYATSPTGQWSEDWPWFMKPQEYGEWIRMLSDPSRSDESLRRCAPSVADDPMVRSWFARVIRNSVSPEGRSAIMRAYEKMDLRHRLGEVRVPTLVMHRRGDHIVPFEAGRQLALAIPGAQFVPLEGEDSFFWFGDCEPVHQAVQHFVSARDAWRTPG